ncbi:TPA: hypothetical protein MI513_10450 [Klebsiella pneumoniae]|uniref:hypothetical protein n=1 Tax=Klebsiella pneumoniae TaxID=573 RepID=UPI000BC7357E|nr:hypothetical protein [Klebsiella pneumoniae]HDT0216224.1 hypothetical protein [Klebsiella pneumoniae subsp. pneumoniae]MBL4433015.1 hypothetical protein [Klebsiella pneumoniae]PCM78613.1 hypothetical protein CP909_04895 [Klebsiella pneumoniae]RDY47703.1 hypothetical protein DX994_04800 [Klebsiella pneumoniae]HBT5934222.1 hypothetical protein [Klebsiella pneumoniae]
MTITLQTVNELIASLESAGELSIREQKFLKLAKAYQQLAAENVALKAFGDKLNKMYDDLNGEGVGWQGRAEVVCQQEALGKAMEEFDAIKTPSTDRIVAGIKADGVEEFAAYQRAITEEWACKEGHSSLLKVAESAEIFAKQLREGAK